MTECQIRPRRESGGQRFHRGRIMHPNRLPPAGASPAGPGDRQMMLHLTSRWTIWALPGRPHRRRKATLAAHQPHNTRVYLDLAGRPLDPWCTPWMRWGTAAPGSHRTDEHPRTQPG
jgi:hypothetical protein